MIRPGHFRIERRWIGRTLGMGMIEADDREQTLASFTLQSQVDLGIDHEAMGSLAFPHIFKTMHLLDETMFVGSCSNENTAAFIRRFLQGVLEDGLLLLNRENESHVAFSRG